jgi:acetyl coenzyme A synthetase (ADP forming)-like protein
MVAYPEAYDVDLVLRDGGVVRVRPIAPQDVDRLRRFFQTLGPESRYFRFFGVKTELTEAELTYFTKVDYHDRMAFVALREDEMIAIGHYERLPGQPYIAEVAFAVSDVHQGRGLGTELLQLLTVYARRHEITAFQALVLGENVQMMRVFRNSGYEVTRTLDSGTYTVDFPVEITEGSRAAEENRERIAVAASILPLFFPRSIAVIGASTTPGTIGYRLFNNLIRTGFTGPVFPINSKAAVVQSVRAYRSITDVPDPVDLAFVAVPAAAVLDVARECAAKAVRGLVVISAGFSEVGEKGRALERDLVSFVREAGMRMVGPNCMGLINTADSTRLNGTFAPMYAPVGNVAMSSQSGALGIAILEYAFSTNLGISQFVSVGNKADVSGNDLLLAWEDDPATDVIVLYLESFGNPRRFHRSARRVGKRKPIIAVKAGRTVAGRKAASSHTGALASLDVAADALFAQSGVVRTDTLEELFAVAAVLANQPVPRGSRVAIITNGGGPGILAADAIESAELELPELSQELQVTIAAPLAPEASTRNPIDLIASANADQYRHCLAALLESKEIDAVLVIYVPTSTEGVGEVASAILEVADRYEGPVTILSVFMQREEVASLLVGTKRTIPSFKFPEMAAVALAKAVGYGRWLERRNGVIPELVDTNEERVRSIVSAVLASAPVAGLWLSPSDVESVLSCFGISVPGAETADTEEEAVTAAERLGYPVALKVVAGDILHKTEVGGVKLNLASAAEVRAAYKRMVDALPTMKGILVQEMVSGGHEVLIGVTEDPSFGPLIGYGLGGVFVELLGDVAFRIHPLTDLDADDMLSGIKGAKLLDGYRNLPPGDQPAVKDLLLRVSALVSAVPQIVEMDLNPVKVLEPGEGVKVVDARIRVKHVSDADLTLVDVPSVKSRHLAP